MIEELSQFKFGDTTVRYLRDSLTGVVGWEWIPTTMESFRTSEADHVATRPLESLIQIKLLGDPYPGGFAHGHTMRNAASTSKFRYQEQRIQQADKRTCIETVFRADDGCALEHRLSWHDGDASAEVTTAIRNGSDSPVTLEMLASFSLAGITPFHKTDASERLRVHRFRSAWSAEARLDTQTIEQLHLERSWSGSGSFSERFGQVGTMPVRKWFPFVSVEDTESGVLWGAQLAWAGSWQMEVYRKHDDIAISGGLADREFGHWMKILQPGEALVAPAAQLSCVRGDLDDLCDRLTESQKHALKTQPQIEQDLPIIFNEFCTTWGDPKHGLVTKIATKLEGSSVRYLVIDAGWYRAEGISWDGGHGDWIPSKELFPDGLEATAAAIRDRGLIPGIWFEMETVGAHATAFSLTDHLLKRDGLPITAGERRFWDLSDRWVVDYLAERVINLLKRCNFGYLKVDYNETLGIGCDHPDSLGEGLRQQVLASHAFFDRIREAVPELVIENCSSGGHRLEPSMLARTAMSSFSDAHELVEIPIIAANLHRLILPRQSQIWAVLRAADSDRRLAYSLAATFLGRMCLSGEVDSLTRDQWDIVQEAMRLYQLAGPVIRDGQSQRQGQTNNSWRHPRGWQAVVRQSSNHSLLLVVVHAFADSPESVHINLPAGSWSLKEQFPKQTARLEDSGLLCALDGDFSGSVLLLGSGGVISSSGS